ncbi:hypothetical protein AAIP58_000107 [Flavobacterium psychrophilum]|nr:hypothetical protein [Flavobacterium psychrophilum]
MENEKDIKRLEVTLAVSLMLIPLINRLIEGVWLPSISAYVDSKVIVGLLSFELGIAGALFIYNGVGFKRHWYNVLLGLSLWGVAIFHYKTHNYIHNACAIIFFLGSILAIGLSSNIAFRGFKYFVSAITVIGLVLHFAFNLFSILTVEWIEIIPIATHFILKSIKTKWKQ